MIKKMDRIFFGMFMLFASLGMAQELLKGRVIDETSEEPIPGVLIELVGTPYTATTDANGYFTFDQDLTEGNQKIRVSFNNYLTKTIPVVISTTNVVNIDPLYLESDNINEQQSVGVISLTENDLAEDENAANNISGLLQASRDQFLRAAAFDFSATFFRPRGLNSEDGDVLINGLRMNKLFSGRPQWSNWGGVNDLQRNQTFTMGLSPAENTFGGLGGVQSIDMRASQQREGTQISVAVADRSYEGRFMVSHRSGLLNNGWSYAILASRRAGDEGFSEGTLYDANSLALSVEKKFSDAHSLNFTGMYTPNRRGRRAPMTQEIRDLKGLRYNPYWGNQDGAVRNSRIREIVEPIFMLNHYWTVNDKLRVNTNVGYQFGKIGNTRIDNGGTRLVTTPDGQNAYIGGARNPNPDYYQNLPSYFLRNGQEPIDFMNAYLAQQEFQADGQLDWASLYEANRLSTQNGGNSIYVIQEDRIDDDLLMANTIISADLTDNILFNGGVSYRKLTSENYARIDDLLGGTGYLDVDFFAQETSDITQDQAAQSDLNNMNRIVGEGDRYKYNYDIFADEVEGFVQAQVKTKKVDFYTALNLSRTTYQRDGKYRNGNFAENSFGLGEKLDFTNYGVKAGATYKVSGKTFLDINGAYFTQAPTIRSSFVNARQNNQTVPGLESQTIYSTDASYIFKSPIVKARLTGYYSKFENSTDISFYFSQRISGLDSNVEGNAFVQEVVSNIDRRNIGMEFGLEVQATPTIKLKAAGSIGQSVYTNNPNFALYSDDFTTEENENGVTFGDGTTNLKDYHVAGGPEKAMQIGFEYRDPDYWWIGATANFFSNAYVDVAPLPRSEGFALDLDGQPIVGYDENVARELLRQEKFGSYDLVNLVGGKSWKIGDKYVGFFATINNVFDTEYRTGGFEQGRNGNYTSLLEDRNNPIEIFAPRYFYGNGRTYYLNFYLRF